MSSFKKNLFSVYAVMAINGVLGLVFVPMAVKLMGVSGYGLYSIYSVLSAYVVLVDLGVSKNYVLLLAAERDDKRKVFHMRTAFGIFLLLSAALVVLMPFLIILIPRYLFQVSVDNVSALRWIVFFSVIEFILAIPTGMTQIACFADEHFNRYSRFTFVSGLYRYGLMFFGIIVFGRPEVVVGLVVSRRILDAFTSRWLMGGLPLAAYRPRVVFGEIYRIIRRTSSLSVAQIFQSTVIAIGSVLVNRSFGLSGLGIYRSAFDLANRIWFVSNGISLVVFPRFVKMLTDKVNRERLFSRIPWILNTSWAGYAVLSATGIVVASHFLAAVGLKQEMELEMFILLLVGVSWNAHSSLSYEFLQAGGRYRLVAGLNGIALITMVTSFFLLQDTLGVAAIGWAWIISQAFYSYFADAMVLSYSGITMQKTILTFKTVILSGSLIIALSYLSLIPFATQIIGLAAVGFLGLWSLLSLRGSYRTEQAFQES